ncbi:TPA: hypothetical protein I8Z14_000570 [Legionella pneumophila]|nr:hypothetical protein [Legionella pneumophila]
MQKQNNTLKKETKRHHEKPNISKATMNVAKANLKEFESKTDEAFLVRAEMDRKLSSL